MMCFGESTRTVKQASPGFFGDVFFCELILIQFIGLLNRIGFKTHQNNEERESMWTQKE